MQCTRCTGFSPSPNARGPRNEVLIAVWISADGDDDLAYLIAAILRIGWNDDQWDIAEMDELPGVGPDETSDPVASRRPDDNRARFRRDMPL